MKKKIVALLLAALLFSDIAVSASGITVNAADVSEGETEDATSETPDDATYKGTDGEWHGMYSPDKELTIVIFGSAFDPEGSAEAIKQISSIGFSSEKVDICYIDCNIAESQATQMESFIKNYGLPDDGISYCYTGLSFGTYGASLAQEAMKKYTAKYTGIYASHYPSYVFTDKNGAVKDFCYDVQYDKDIVERMESMGYEELIPEDFGLNSNYFEAEFEVICHQTDARQMLDAINEFRTGDDAWEYDVDGVKVYHKNMEALEYDYELEKVAMQRAAELVANYSHTRPNGQPFYSAYSKEYRSGALGENAAIVFSSTYEKPFELWKEEDEDYWGQGHRRNMLHESYKSVGIAHVEYGGYHFWIQEFSGIAVEDKTVIEANDSKTKAKIDILKEDVKPTKLLHQETVNMEVGESKPAPQPRLTIRTEYASVMASDLLLVDPVAAEWELFSPGSSCLQIADDGSLKAVKEGQEDVLVVYRYNGTPYSTTVTVKIGDLDATPAPSETPEPTATPEPTETPKPTKTPEPSETPGTLATSKPSAAPGTSTTPGTSPAPGISTTPGSSTVTPPSLTSNSSESSTEEMMAKIPTITVKKGNKKVGSSLKIKKKKTVTLTVITNPENAGITLAKLSAKQKKVLTAKLKNGKLTIKGKKKGKVTLTLRCGGKTKKITIKVS